MSEFFYKTKKEIEKIQNQIGLQNFLAAVDNLVSAGYNINSKSDEKLKVKTLDSLGFFMENEKNNKNEFNYCYIFRKFLNIVAHIYGGSDIIIEDKEIALLNVVATREETVEVINLMKEIRNNNNYKMCDIVCFECYKFLLDNTDDENKKFQLLENMKDLEFKNKRIIDYVNEYNRELELSNYNLNIQLCLKEFFKNKKKQVSI